MPRYSNQSKTEVTAFEIDLPKELDIKPKFSVMVSKSIRANVYDITFKETLHQDGKQETYDSPGFIIDYINDKTGMPSNKCEHLYYNRHHRNSGTCRDLLTVMLELKYASAHLRPRVKKTQVEEDYDD